MRPVDPQPTAHLSRAFQAHRAGVHRKFSQCSRFATCPRGRGFALADWRPAAPGADGFRKPVAASRQGAMSGLRTSLRRRSSRWSPARWLAAGASGRRGAAGGAPPRPEAVLDDNARLAALLAGRAGHAAGRRAGRRDQRPGPARRRARPRRAAAALDGPVRRGRAVPDRRGGRRSGAQLAEARGGRPLQPVAAPGRLGADLPGRRRPGAGRLRRALGPALVHRRHRGRGAGGAPSPAGSSGARPRSTRCPA